MPPDPDYEGFAPKPSEYSLLRNAKTTPKKPQQEKTPRELKLPKLPKLALQQNQRKYIAAAIVLVVLVVAWSTLSSSTHQHQQTTTGSTAVVSKHSVSVISFRPGAGLTVTVIGTGNDSRNVLRVRGPGVSTMKTGRSVSTTFASRTGSYTATDTDPGGGTRIGLTSVSH